MQITCDGCGKAKQSANHWWQVWHVDPNQTFIAIAPANNNLGSSQPEFARDFCGSACTLKYISEQLGKSEQ